LNGFGIKPKPKPKKLYTGINLKTETGKNWIPVFTSKRNREKLDNVNNFKTETGKNWILVL